VTTSWSIQNSPPDGVWIFNNLDPVSLILKALASGLVFGNAEICIFLGNINTLFFTQIVTISVTSRRTCVSVPSNEVS